MVVAVVEISSCLFLFWEFFFYILWWDPGWSSLVLSLHTFALRTVSIFVFPFLCTLIRLFSRGPQILLSPVHHVFLLLCPNFLSGVSFCKMIPFFFCTIIWISTFINRRIFVRPRPSFSAVLDIVCLASFSFFLFDFVFLFIALSNLYLCLKKTLCPSIMIDAPIDQSIGLCTRPLFVNLHDIQLRTNKHNNFFRPNFVAHHNHSETLKTIKTRSLKLNEEDSTSRFFEIKDLGF